MNINRVRGMVMLAVGKLQERCGWLMRSPAQQVRGIQRQLVGRTGIALADAQKAIQRCMEAESVLPDAADSKKQTDLNSGSGRQPLDAA